MITEWLANHRCISPTGPRDSSLVVAEVIRAYWQYVRSYYVKNGRPTKEQANIKLAMRALQERYGPTPAGEFGPLALKAVREDLITADLSRLGGPSSVPLRETGEQVYELTTDLTVNASSGWKEVWIAIDQATSLGSYRTTLVKSVKVLPASWPQEDLPLFTDAVTGTWQVSSPENLVVDTQESTVV